MLSLTHSRRPAAAWGKDDRALSRLASYRVLERKATARLAFAPPPKPAAEPAMTARQLDRAFLRQSRVRAVLVPVLRADEPDLDRLSDAN